MISDWATNQVQWLCFLHSTICVFNAIDCKPLHQTGSQWRCLVYNTPAPPVWQLICYAKLPWPCPCRKVVKFAIDSRGRLSQGYVSCGQMSPGSLIVWVTWRRGHLSSWSHAMQPEMSIKFHAHIKNKTFTFGFNYTACRVTILKFRPSLFFSSVSMCNLSLRTRWLDRFNDVFNNKRRRR